MTEEVGAIVVATGYKLYSVGRQQAQRPPDAATANMATAATRT